MTQTADEPSRPQAASSLSIRELLEPGAFGHPVCGLQLRETHISWGILTGQAASTQDRAVRVSWRPAPSAGSDRRPAVSGKENAPSR